MDLLDQCAKIFRFPPKRVTILCVAIFSIASNQASFSQELTNCGQPDFDRFTDRGVFLWQNCGTGDWFLRATNGGVPGETGFNGNLKLSADIEFIAGFNLDPGVNGNQDTLDTSDPRNIDFSFRVFVTAQDGINFRVDPDALACMSITNTANAPVVVGQNSIDFTRPVNIQTLTREGCVGPVLTSPIMLLLLGD